MYFTGHCKQEETLFRGKDPRKWIEWNRWRQNVKLGVGVCR